MFGNFITCLRISLGDFDFDGASMLTPNENALFFIIWLCIVFLTSIIFLNFVIAEATASYESVKESLDAQINKSKAILCAEIDNIMPDMAMNN